MIHTPTYSHSKMIDTRSDQERQADAYRPRSKRTKAQQKYFEKFGHLVPWDEPALVSAAVAKACGMTKESKTNVS
jgi:hypothetical protein